MTAHKAKIAQNAMRALCEIEGKSLREQCYDASLIQLGMEISVAQPEYIKEFMEVLFADGMPHQIRLETVKRWAEDFALVDEATTEP